MNKQPPSTFLLSWILYPLSIFPASQLCTCNLEDASPDTPWMTLIYTSSFLSRSGWQCPIPSFFPWLQAPLIFVCCFCHNLSHAGLSVRGQTFTLFIIVSPVPTTRSEHSDMASTHCHVICKPDTREQMMRGVSEWASVNNALAKCWRVLVNRKRGAERCI